MFFHVPSARPTTIFIPNPFCPSPNRPSTVKGTPSNDDVPSATVPKCKDLDVATTAGVPLPRILKRRPCGGYCYTRKTSTPSAVAHTDTDPTACSTFPVIPPLALLSGPPSVVAAPLPPFEAPTSAVLSPDSLRWSAAATGDSCATWSAGGASPLHLLTHTTVSFSDSEEPTPRESASPLRYFQLDSAEGSLGSLPATQRRSSDYSVVASLSPFLPHAIVEQHQTPTISTRGGNRTEMSEMVFTPLKTATQRRLSFLGQTTESSGVDGATEQSAGLSTTGSFGAAVEGNHTGQPPTDPRTPSHDDATPTTRPLGSHHHSSGCFLCSISTPAMGSITRKASITRGMTAHTPKSEPTTPTKGDTSVLWGSRSLGLSMLPQEILLIPVTSYSFEMEKCVWVPRSSELRVCAPCLPLGVGGMRVSFDVVEIRRDHQGRIMQCKPMVAKRFLSETPRQPSLSERTENAVAGNALLKEQGSLLTDITARMYLQEAAMQNYCDVFAARFNRAVRALTAWQRRQYIIQGRRGPRSWGTPTSPTTSAQGSTESASASLWRYPSTTFTTTTTTATSSESLPSFPLRKHTRAVQYPRTPLPCNEISFLRLEVVCVHADDLPPPPHTSDLLFSAQLTRRTPEVEHKSRGPVWCFLESKLWGDFTKYNNNYGEVYERHPPSLSSYSPPRGSTTDHFRLRRLQLETAEAFTHFTLADSKGRLLVCDLQGVGLRFTDPQIHSWNGEGFGTGNMGLDGILRWVRQHRCNEYCTGLGLSELKHHFPGDDPTGDAPNWTREWRGPPPAPCGSEGEDPHFQALLSHFQQRDNPSQPTYTEMETAFSAEKVFCVGS